MSVKTLWTDDKTTEDVEYLSIDTPDNVIYNLQEDILCLKESIAELEKENITLRAVLPRYLTMNDREQSIHNLEQQAKGVKDFKKWVLDTDQNSSGLDVRDISLIEFYVEPLISQAKALKETKS
jgi:hypothetical protein